MEFIKNNNKIYIESDNNKILAEIEYEKQENNVYNIYHTFVDESLRGQGIASKLVEQAVNDIKNRGGKVTATCSYAKKWLEKNIK